MQNTISLPVFVFAIIAVLELLWIVRLLDFGKLVRRSNELPKFGANPDYNWVQVRREGASTVWLALTDAELDTAIKRAESNAEDQP